MASTAPSDEAVDTVANSADCPMPNRTSLPSMLAAGLFGPREPPPCPAPGGTAPKPQTHRPRHSRGRLAPPADCRFVPPPGSACSSGRCEPRPETRPRLAYRVPAPPGPALMAIKELPKRRLRRRIGRRAARPRRQPTQLWPMQQPIGARQTAINIKLFVHFVARRSREMPPLRRAPTRR